MKTTIYMLNTSDPDHAETWWFNADEAIDFGRWVVSEARRMGVGAPWATVHEVEVPDLDARAKLAILDGEYGGEARFCGVIGRVGGEQ